MVRQSENGDRFAKVLSGIGLAVSVAAIIAVAAEWRRVVIFMSSTMEMQQKCDQVVEDLSELGTTVTQLKVERPLLVTRFETELLVLQRSIEELRKTIEDGLAERPPDWLKADMDKIREEDKRLQQQIDRLENEVFFGKRKPLLSPYTGD